MEYAFGNAAPLHHAYKTNIEKLAPVIAFPPCGFRLSDAAPNLFPPPMIGE